MMTMYPENLDVAYAKTLKQELNAMLKAQKAITLPMQNVQRASAASVQVLLAAKQKADNEHIPFALETSDAFNAILEDLGVAHLFTTKE